MRGRLRMPDYLYLLLALVFVRSQEEERWSRYVKDTRAALRELELPEHAEVPLAEVVRFLDGGPPTSGEESRQAFDRLLELLSNTDPGGAGGFFTPRSVSHVMGGALAARRRAKRLHDPFCRTGELLTAYLEASAERGDETPVAVVGRTPTEELLPVVRMNLTMHGVEQAQVLQGPWMPGRLDESGDRPGSFDTVITNPPFGSLGPWPDAPPRYWRYGTTRSSEFDWLQYVVSCLSPDGRAAVLMPAGAGFRGSAERLTRTRLIQDGVVECVMALPTHLFERTAIQTHIWFLRSPGGRAEQVLFVDGTRLGSMATRTRRELSDAEIDRLVTVYTSWCEAGTGGMEQAGGAGLGRAVDTAEIEANDFRLEPALYVREHVPSAGAIDDQAAVRSHLAELSAHLERLHAEARATDGLVDKRLRRYGL
ncbi:N-6 DNA methylase [Streptomyces griseorubiginosus]|uniref:N-6 DNA methylase n=1 Tax=Streptomyces griseorubiginosus TaxID=67304 RepID=UPI0033E04245